MSKWAPVRKIAVAGVAAAVAFVALRLGVDLGPDGANQAALALVTLLAGYITPHKQ